RVTGRGLGGVLIQSAISWDCRSCRGSGELSDGHLKLSRIASREIDAQDQVILHRASATRIRTTMEVSQSLPSRISDVDALDEWMTRPSGELIHDLEAVEGDLLILGVGGKMGPSLARMAKRATPKARVIGVARFTT